MELDLHIVSHFIYTGKELLKNGMISFNSNHEIIELKTTDLKHVESARTQFLSGIVLPAPFLFSEGKHLEQLKKLDIISPDNLVLNISGLTNSQLCRELKEKQEEFKLYGVDCLHLWNAISIAPAKGEGKDYFIKAGNKLPLLNIKGAEPGTFKLNDKSSFHLVRL